MIKLRFPTIIGLLVSNVCNLQCRHCCYCSSPYNRIEMEFKVIAAYLRKWADKGMVCIDISGGEPLLRRDLIDLVSFCKDIGLQVSIATNGTLVSSAIAIALARTGVTSVRVSIDGDRGQHDWLRGSGAYDKAVRGIKLLVSAGVKTSIITVVHRRNWQKIENIFHLAQKLEVSKIKLIPLLPLGRGVGLRQLVPDSEMWRNIMEWVHALPEGEIPQIVADSPLDCIYERPSQDNSQRACVSGICYIAVKSNGEAIPCPIWDVELGNVHLTTLEEIWHTSPILAKIRNPDFLHNTCQKCTLRNKCNGGCRAMSYLIQGGITWPDPLCWIANQSDVKRMAMQTF